MNIHIWSVKRFYRFLEEASPAPGTFAALLSSSYPLQEEKLAGVAYVFCQYDDIDRPVPGRSFPYEDGADRFARFLRSLPEEVTDLYCCCDGGCRRSAAVACAAVRHFGGEDLYIWEDPRFEPNPLVYELLCRALNLPLSDPDMDFRIETNRRAVKNALRR